jgi:hypothetical protein
MLCAAALVNVSSQEQARAESQDRGRVDLRVIGRLDSQPRVRMDGQRTTLVGTLGDETGLPVTGAIAVLEPSPEEWTACHEATPKLPAPAGVPTDASGNYCLRGPALPDNTRIGLRLTAESHQTRELTLPGEHARRAAAHITLAPGVIDLDQQEAFEVDAMVDPAASLDAAELFVECGDTRTLLGRARAEAGHLHFALAVALLPGPGSCAWIVRGEVDSSPRAVTLKSPARLRSLGWTTEGGRPKVAIRVELEWGPRRAPLIVGVLEGQSAKQPVWTVPLSDAGVGILEFDALPEGPLSIRLARAPIYVASSNVLSLPPPRPWVGWVYVQGALLVALAAWLVSSWRSFDKKGPGPSASARAKSAATSRPHEVAVSGRAVDAHTGFPVQAKVELRALGTSSQELVLAVTADAEGRFSLPPRRPAQAGRSGAADGYLPADDPLPPGSPVLRMTQRRRAALAIFAGWVRPAKGTPGPLGPSRAPLPTPGEVEQRARAAQKGTVADWARDVAAAAYGATPPTDADLSALDERKPS